MTMLNRVQSEEGTVQRAPDSAVRIACFGLVLACALICLPFIKGGWFDARWCFVLASAWLNVLTVGLGAHLALRGGTRARGVIRRPQGLHVWRRSWWRSLAVSIGMILRAIDWTPWAVLICAVLSVLVASAGWRPPLRFAVVPTLPPNAAIVFGGSALGLAFGTLVAELFHSMHAVRSRVSMSLANVLRVALLGALAAAICTGLQSYAGISVTWAARAMSVLCAAIALEFALRAIAWWFMPSHARGGEAVVPDSLLASLLRWRPSPLLRFSEQLHHRYGVDLRQNWVLRSAVRLLPAAIVATGVCAWLLTGVVILGPEQRAVYERFGAPVAVWQPGVHVALPRPFGRARSIDNGAVRQLMVSGSTGDGLLAIPTVSADADAPEQLNRLWDVAHQGETSQVIAGASGDGQNFQIVSADVRLDYRIGASDAAARASLYRVTDYLETLRTMASREVVGYLASHTLASLLETRQTVMADRIRRGLQTQLDQFDSGVEVIAVVIESVHPPAGASVAWHSVQAAQIRAEASVAQAHGLAAEALGDAQQQAQTELAQADAQAGETRSAARMQQTSFSADMLAAQAGGPAFVLEYYLHHLQKGLQNAHVTVIDDRLLDGNRATIDLRSYGAGDAAGVKRFY
jgi:regulator of protease activity HflC (stomatin/prohibitin superfamily)